MDATPVIGTPAPEAKAESRAGLDGSSALVLVAATLGVLFSVSNRIASHEFWAHLAVGRSIWDGHGLPTHDVWSWPTYGASQVLPSWGFSAILWPFWTAAGPAGLVVLRWATALLAFGLAWLAARRMGARGLVPAIAAVIASLIFRERSSVLPDLVAAVFLAFELWVLEMRRSGGRDLTLWLVPVACLWANVDPSWPLGLAAIAAYALGDVARRRPHGFAAPLTPHRGRLWLVLLGAIAISFVNPWGWRALAEPFETFGRANQDPIDRTMIELSPTAWLPRWRSGLPLFLFGWPLLLAGRWIRKGFDLVEALLCALLTWLMLSMERWLGLYAVAAFPFVARDLAALVTLVPTPSWARSAGTRAAIVAAVCLAVGIPEWSRPEQPLGLGLDAAQYPAKAADFIAAQNVRGRMFNQLPYGGYLAHRFWPDRDRLPFMLFEGSGTRNDRVRYASAFTDVNGWAALDHTYRFDYALLDASQNRGDTDWLRDKLDSDTTWSLVFLDDAGALYVKRSGPLAEVARRFEYLAIPAGEGRLELLGTAITRDSMLAQLARFELNRQIRESPFSARAHSMLANIDMQQGDFASAGRHLHAALQQDPLAFAAHERLGMLAFVAGRPKEAMRELQTERRLTGGSPELEKRIAEVRVALGRGPATR